MRKYMNIHKNQQGSALIWVIILLVVIFILATSVLFIANQNNRETAMQEDRISAYYISLSGIEIGYTYLMTEKSGVKEIEKFTSSTADITHHQDILDTSKTIGSVDVTIGNVTLKGKRWIQIKSVGKLNGKNASSSNTLRIDASNNEIIIRE